MARVNTRLPGWAGEELNKFIRPDANRSLVVPASAAPATWSAAAIVRASAHNLSQAIIGCNHRTGGDNADKKPVTPRGPWHTISRLLSTTSDW